MLFYITIKAYTYTRFVAFKKIYCIYTIIHSPSKQFNKSQIQTNFAPGQENSLQENIQEDFDILNYENNTMESRLHHRQNRTEETAD